MSRKKDAQVLCSDDENPEWSWRVLDETIAEARSKFADVRPDELETIIEQAVTAARSQHPTQRG